MKDTFAIGFYKQMRSMKDKTLGISFETYYFLTLFFASFCIFLSTVIIYIFPNYGIYTIIPMGLVFVILLFNGIFVYLFRALSFPIVFDIFKMKLKKQRDKCFIFVIDSSKTMSLRIGIIDNNLKRAYDPIGKFYYKYEGSEVFTWEGFPALVVYNGIGEAIDTTKVGILQQIHNMGFKTKYDFINGINSLKAEAEKTKQELSIANTKGDANKVAVLTEKLNKINSTMNTVEMSVQPFIIQNLNLESVMSFMSNQNAHLDLLSIETALTAGMQLAKKDDIYGSMPDMKWLIILGLLAVAGVIGYKFFMG